MKKILACLFLCLLMLLPVVMTGCGEEKDPAAVAAGSNGPVTLTLYCPTDASTTAEAVSAVEEQLNKYTNSKYNTKIVLRLIEESKYEETIEGIYENIRAELAAKEAEEERILEEKRQARLSGQTYVESTTEAPETLPAFIIDEETGKKLTVYPEAGENQLDIFLMTDFKTFKEHILAEEIAPLDEYLNNSCKLLKSYIYPTFLSSVKDKGKTYAIPNNGLIGEYEYLFLNKELVDKYSYYPSDLKDLNSLSDYLKAIARYETDVIPFAGDITAPIELMEDGTWIGIFNKDLHSSGNHSAFKPTSNAPKNLLAATDYVNWLDLYHTLTEDKLIVKDAPLNGKIGAKIVKGDCTISPTYADDYGFYKVDEKTGLKYFTDENGVEYYVNVYKAPLASNANMFKSIFCVSAYSVNVEKAMNILLEINTNREIRRLFQYGVENVNYEVSEFTGLIHVLNKDYSMNPANTGNILILDKCEDWDADLLKLAENDWERIKKQNLESIPSPMLGFYTNPTEIPEEHEILEDDPNYVLNIDKSYADCLKGAAELTKQLEAEFAGYVAEYKEDGELKTTYKNHISGVATKFGNDKGVTAILDLHGAYAIAPVYNAWFAIQFK